MKITSIYQDHAGTMWFATYRGIDRLVGERFVSAIHLTSGSNAVLLGEDPSGNLYFSGQDVFEFSSKDARLKYYEILGDAMATLGQDLWCINSAHGILRINPDSLRNWNPRLDAPLDYAMFGKGDGLTHTDRASGRPTITVTPNQRVWAAVTDGLAMIDYGRLPRSTVKPITCVGELSVDGHKQAPGKELTLSPGPHRLELDFDSIELTSPDRTRLQYRFDGADRNWLDAEPIHTAVYSTVPLGRHQFHVRATNQDGIWDREGIVYWVDQRPYYYETALFRAAMVVFGILLVAAIYRLRLRQAAEKLNARLEGKLAEREQIAHDLHDTILQGIQGLVMLFEAGTDQLPDAEPSKAVFEKALAHASNVIAEGRDRLQNLRSSP